MSQDPGAIMRRWFEEVWNQGREEVIDELFTEDGVAHTLGEGSADVRGPEGFKVFWRNIRAAVPDLHFRIEDTIVQEDKAAVRVVLEGTHRGEGLGVPPSGRRVSVAGIVIGRIVDGRLVEAWNSWDQLGMLRQIGVIPAPDADRFVSPHSRPSAAGKP